MSSATQPLSDAIASLRPGEVKLYLASHGWRATPYGTGGKGFELTHPDHPNVDLLLPTKRELRDFTVRMTELVDNLAAIEDRSVLQVLNDLTGASADVLRFQLSADVATLGSLPLEQGIQFLRGGHDLLLAAAASTNAPHALHPVQPARPVREFMKSCRLGQTERGSFVATFLLPVPPDIGSPMLPFGDDASIESEPFTRRVSSRLMSSLGVVSSAIETGATARILDAIEEGVSANLCEALNTMKPPGESGSLRIGVSWARTRSSMPIDVPVSVSFHQENFAIIQEAGRRLRTRARPIPERFAGKVIELREAQRSLFEGVAGWITIQTEVGDRRARVKVALSAEDFRKACDALRDKHRVAITGIIRENVRAYDYELSDPTGFEVLKPR